MISEMIDITIGDIKQGKNSWEIKAEKHDLNLNIKQEAPDEISSEVEVEENDLNFNVKQEVPDETGLEIKVEEHGVHLTVKREEKCLGFGKYSSSTPANFTTTLRESELHRENVCPDKRGRSRKRNFRRHANSHINKKLVDCPHCNYKGKQKIHLLLHLKRNHPNELPHACDFCSYRSLDLSCLEKHREKHKRDMMKCEFCNEFTTTDWMQMQSHKRQIHVRSCIHCNYKSLYADKLKQHMSMHETEKILSCPNCKYKTELQYNLDRHIASKHTVGNTDFKAYNNCPDCPFTTNYSRTFQSHYYQHTGIRPFPCDQRDYKALEKRNLEMHILYKHTTEKPFKCEVYKKSYAIQSDLQVHLSVHSKKKLFCCDECNFSNIYKSSLKGHKQTKHSKTFACKVCNYKAGSDIKKHVEEHNLDSHTGCKCTVENADLKTYSCLDCPFKANQSRTYKSHCYRHTAERPFPCDQCDYKALQKYHLKTHILYKHSNEKPYKCKVCQKGYAVQADLQVHLSVHSKNKPFHCTSATSQQSTNRI